MKSILVKTQKILIFEEISLSIPVRNNLIYPFKDFEREKSQFWVLTKIFSSNALLAPVLQMRRGRRLADQKRRTIICENFQS